jgi:hypothetical protein
MTAASIFGAIAAVSCVLVMVLDKRKLSLRLTLPELRARMMPATPVVRTLQIIAMVSMLLSIYASIRGF